MNQIDPKLDFQTFTPTYSDEIRKNAPQPWFRYSCNVALAKMAYDGSTTEELAGARKFLEALYNLGEVRTELPRLPVKTLDDPDELAAKLAAQKK